MSTNEESKEQLILLVSAIFGLISCIIGILATSTSGWQVDGPHNKTGLFQTCYKDRCTSLTEHHSTPVALAIVGHCLLAFGVIGSFMTAFVYMRRIACAIVALLFFLGSLFLWATFMTSNSYLLMNGGSATIFDAALAFALFATFTASYAVGSFFSDDFSDSNSHIRTQSRASVVPFKIARSNRPFELYPRPSSLPSKKQEQVNHESTDATGTEGENRTHI